jgi:hypothetical protein
VSVALPYSVSASRLNKSTSLKPSPGTPRISLIAKDGTTAPVQSSLRITTKVLLWHLPIVGTTVRVIGDTCLGVCVCFDAVSVIAWMARNHWK